MWEPGPEAGSEHRNGDRICRVERIRGPRDDRIEYPLSERSRARARFGFHDGAAGLLLRRFGAQRLRKVDLASGAPRYGASSGGSSSRVRSARLGLGSASACSRGRRRIAVGVPRLSHYRAGARGDGALPLLGRPPIRNTHGQRGHIQGHACVRHREPGTAIPLDVVRR